MKNFFKFGEFDGCDTNDDCIYKANEKLNALIESWPVVYDGNSGHSFFKSETWGLNRYDEKDYASISSNFTSSKRKARLAFIEEIVKEPCKHEPTDYDVHWKKHNLQALLRRIKSNLERKMKFPKLFKDARLKKNMSQNDASNAIGVCSSQFISNIERGIAFMPTKYIKIISLIFDIPLREVEQAIIDDYVERAREKIATECRQAEL